MILDDLHDFCSLPVWHWFLMTFGIDFDSILAPLWHQNQWCFIIFSFSDSILSIFIRKCSQFVPGDAPFLDTFSHLDPSCSQGVFWDVPWPTLAPFLVPFLSFGYLFDSILASEMFLFGIRICKASVEQPQTHSSKELHLTRATCGTLQQVFD